MRKEICKIKIPGSILFLIIGLSQIGCKKTDLTFPNKDLANYKVFYDTLANPENYAVSMDAGYGRIFMAYGTNSLGTGNSYGYSYGVRKSALIAADNEGNFLWKAKVPDAMEMNALLALEDGGCLLIAPCFDTKNPKYSNKNLYIFRYDANGNLSKADSVSFVPSITESFSMRSVKCLRINNGNILAYGDVFVYKSSATYGNNAGWVMEYSISSGLVSLKTHLYPNTSSPSVYMNLSGCLETPDNNLLFCGYFQYYDSNWKEYWHPYLMKTNRAGDTLWTKKLSLADGMVFPANIVATQNGHYWFGFSEYSYTDLTKPTRIQIVEFDQNGDSLKGVTIEHKTDTYIAKILPVAGGGCFALLTYGTENSISYSRRRYFDKSQSRKAFFDANLKETGESPFQGLTTDFITQTCYTSDGHLACFGLQQPVGRTFYLPHLYIFN